MQQDYYAATAYEYQYWKTTPMPEPHQLKGNHPLEFGDYARVVPSTYLKGLYASLKDEGIAEDDGLFQFNHQCIRTVTGGRAWLGILCQFGGSLLVIGGTAIVIGVLLLSLYFAFSDLKLSIKIIKEMAPIIGCILIVGLVFLGLVRLPPLTQTIFLVRLVPL
ncbi:hypothetical protein [Motilimonas eburnea]|uniref:hypothetical protein n=1 Tax=Motilimonas eburnea TaxID=1737488 RepID=UPI001E58A3B7|nr:hypothetical protein [Motilimonas eburnea]MCE2570431.1 hypothetical protein [Motilimonas eburnea]